MAVPATLMRSFWNSDQFPEHTVPVLHSSSSQQVWSLWIQLHVKSQVFEFSFVSRIKCLKATSCQILKPLNSASCQIPSLWIQLNVKSQVFEFSFMSSPKSLNSALCEISSIWIQLHVKNQVFEFSFMSRIKLRESMSWKVTMLIVGFCYQISILRLIYHSIHRRLLSCES